MIRHFVRPGDFVAIILVLLVAAGLSFLLIPGLFGAAGQPTEVVVRSLRAGAAGEVVKSVLLPDDTEFFVAGETGGLYVEVEGYQARVFDADCPRRLCIGGWMDSVGERSICAPNQLVVELKGEPGERDFDDTIR